MLPTPLMFLPCWSGDKGLQCTGLGVQGEYFPKLLGKSCLCTNAVLNQMKVTRRCGFTAGKKLGKLSDGKETEERNQ